MSESGALAGAAEDVKTEAKAEPAETCVVCGAAAAHSARAAAAVGAVLRPYARADLCAAAAACLACLELLELLEAARLHYVRLRDALERLLAPNPLFRVPSPTEKPHPAHPASPAADPDLNSVKQELEDQSCEDNVDIHFGTDSDNEPLLITKKKRHRLKSSKKKKLKYSKNHKRKNGWENEEPKSEEFILPDPTLGSPTLDIKKEDDTSGYHNNSNDSSYNTKTARRGRGRPRKPEGAARPVAKVLHACDQCNSKFSTLGRLQQHARRHASGPFICEVCGAHYKHRRACDVHIAMHKGISDWKCEPCNKLFPSKGALQRHNNIHTGKLNYQCEECGKSFIHTSSFKMHALTHSGVKPHKCAVCGLGLLTSSHLKRHLRVHSGEKRYTCPVCAKGFSERYNLIAHSKSHEVEGGGGVGGADSPPAPRAPVSLPHFRCPYCPERFPRKYMLERHCSASHGRALERLPPRPRNTMSKLLKAQAAAKHLAAVPEPPVKDDPSPPAAAPVPPPAPALAPTPAPAPAPSPVAAVSSATAECATQAALGVWGLQYRSH